MRRDVLTLAARWWADNSESFHRARLRLGQRGVTALLLILLTSFAGVCFTVMLALAAGRLRSDHLEQAVGAVDALIVAEREEAVAAAAYVAAVWQLASTAQRQAFAAPSGTAVDAAVATERDAYAHAIAATDGAMDAALRVLNDHGGGGDSRVDAALLMDVKSGAGLDIADWEGQRGSVGELATRNPTLVRDEARLGRLRRDRVSFSGRQGNGEREGTPRTIGGHERGADRLEFSSLEELLAPATLAALRAAHVPTVALAPSMSRQLYQERGTRLLRFASALVASSRTLATEGMVSALATSAVATVVELHALGADLLATAGRDATRTASDAELTRLAVSFLRARDTVDFVTNAVVVPLVPPTSRALALLHRGAAANHNVTAKVASGIVANVLRPAGGASADAVVAAGATAEQLAHWRTEIDDVAREMMRRKNDYEQRRVRNRTICFAVGIALCILGFFLAAFSVSRSSQADAVADSRRRADAMAVLQRTREFATSVRRWTVRLSDTPPCMQGVLLGTIEAKLQRTLAALRYVAPTLNPLLLPRRCATIAAQLHDDSERSKNVGAGAESMKRSDTPGGAAKPGGDKDGADGGDEGAIANSNNEGLPAALDAQLAHATALGQRMERAVFLNLDVSAMHEFGNQQAKLLATQQNDVTILKIFEEQVLLHGGTPFSVTGDHFIASFGLNMPAALAASPGELCETGCRCAFALAAALSLYAGDREAHAQMLGPRLGLAFGEVAFGTFGKLASDHESVNAGDEGHESPAELRSPPCGLRVVNVFGPPLVTVAEVAQANVKHGTVVAVDDAVRAEVERRGLPCKPIELLRGGGRANELVGLHQQHDNDLHAKLAAYKRAFSLYEKRYTTEALKEFRRYTKRFGYDRSVECITKVLDSS